MSPSGIVHVFTKGHKKFVKGVNKEMGEPLEAPHQVAPEESTEYIS